MAAVTMRSAVVTMSTNEPARKNSVVFHSPSASFSWPITQKERNAMPAYDIKLEPPKLLKNSTAIPAVKRSQTQRSISSILDFVKLGKTPESARNGDRMSQLREIFWQAVQELSPLCTLAAMMMSNPSRSLLLGVTPALAFGLPGGAKVKDFVRRVEVKSKKKKNHWKMCVAMIDTGCHSGNWVSVQVVQKLGITGPLLPLTAEEQMESVCAGGGVLAARAAVELTWHGIPDEGLLNCSRTFKMRFLVAAVHDPPFEMLIGVKSICEDNILSAPTLMSRHIYGLPKENKAQQTPASETFAERRKKNDAAFEAAVAEEAAKRAEEERNAKAAKQMSRYPDTPMDSRAPSFASVKSQDSGDKPQRRMIIRSNSNQPLQDMRDDKVKSPLKSKTPKTSRVH